ncbi:MAG: hypothetical protein IPM23_22630 [Candidatus Melainabacteria bacterium]|nr:hypothetical protein [Candidatus Melainabacteria bacterium]
MRFARCRKTAESAASGKTLKARLLVGVFFVLALVLALGPALVLLPGPAPPARAADSFVPTSQYVVQNVEGWSVMVNRHLLTDQAKLGGRALGLLRQKLNYIRRVVPAHACAQLQEVRIWLGVNDGHSPCSEYHFSREWLKEHGYNPDKARSVEIGNAKLFTEWSVDQPMMVLHELAHAFHDQVLGQDNQGIKESFDHARESRLYESVLDCKRNRRRAYALTNEKEYFAECTEAYFGKNDFYPFNRADLQRYDPQMYALLGKLWQQ